jgi:glucosyl-dolichyl phosphate glucuronosyltransferase
MRASYPSISLIIFTYNSSDLIQRNLMHIIAALEFFPMDNEIILVDNNSTDNTLEIVKKIILKYNIKMRIVKNPKQGLSFSRIEGVKVASKEFVCFIDDDNFLSEKWFETLVRIIQKYNPDVIGCRTIGIADIPFPTWWETDKGTYACGIRFKDTGFLNNPLDKMWGAGLTARTKFLKPALLRMNLLCTGRIGEKQMSGEDSELNYRMRLLGAKFYNSNDLFLEHYMRSGRLNKEHLKKTRIGNGLGGINLDIYKFLLTNKNKYKLFNLALLILIGALPLSIKYKTNYFKYALMRFKTLRKRLEQQSIIKQKFVDINLN